jgi:hypothetical protein
LQLVLKQEEAQFHYEDISALGNRVDVGDQKETLVRDYRKEDRRKLFNLGRGPLMRFALFHLSDDEYEFTWSNHHILMDGWCRGILVSDFFEIYNGLLEDRPPQLSPAAPFKNYITWLDKIDRQAARQYWTRYLDAYEDTAPVPKMKEARALDEGETSNQQVAFGLDEKQTKALNHMAAQNHVTLNTVIQAIWGVLLGKLNGKKDVVFGAVVSGRPPEVNGIESMIGLFLNTVPVRIQFQHSTPFNTLLSHTQDIAVESEPHHYLPLSDIQMLTPLRQNLFDHLLTFENYPTSERIEGVNKKAGQRPGENRLKLKVKGFDFFERTNYDLNVLILPGDQLTVNFNYNPGSYKKEWMTDLAGRFKRMIELTAGDEYIKIEELIGSSEESKEEIMAEFNDELENE